MELTAVTISQKSGMNEEIMCAVGVRFLACPSVATPYSSEHLNRCYLRDKRDFAVVNKVNQRSERLSLIIQVDQSNYVSSE